MRDIYSAPFYSVFLFVEAASMYSMFAHGLIADRVVNLVVVTCFIAVGVFFIGRFSSAISDVYVSSSCIYIASAHRARVIRLSDARIATSSHYWGIYEARDGMLIRIARFVPQVDAATELLDRPKLHAEL